MIYVAVQILVRKIKWLEYLDEKPKSSFKSFGLAIVNKTLAQFPRWTSIEMFCLMNDVVCFSLVFSMVNLPWWICDWMVPKLQLFWRKLEPYRNPLTLQNTSLPYPPPRLLSLPFEKIILL